MIRRPPRSTLFPYTTLFRSPLAMTMRSGQDRHAAGRVNAELGTLVETGPSAERPGDRRGCDAARLDIGGDADAAQFPARHRVPAAGLEALIVGRLQRQLQCRPVIAAVVL